jgi:hypothetical protein
MHRVIKSLATKVLMADKRAFREMAQLLFPLVYQQLWRPRMSELIAALQSVRIHVDADLYQLQLSELSTGRFSSGSIQPAHVLRASGMIRKGQMVNLTLTRLYPMHSNDHAG